MHRFEAQSIKECAPPAPIFMKSDLSRYKEVTPKEFVALFHSENLKAANDVINMVQTKESQVELIKKIKSWNNFIEK